MTTTDTPRRYMTVVYEIVDETEWRKTNPLRYAHNGLSAVTVCIDDACEKLDEAEAEVERLRSELKSSVNLLAKFNTLRLCKSASLTQEQWDRYCRLYRDYN